MHTLEDRMPEQQPLRGLQDEHDDADAISSQLADSTNACEKAVIESSTSSKIPRWNLRSSQDWALEIAASCFSIFCFVGLVILLVKSNGKQQRFWFGHRLTLNGLIALMATITRAAIMVAVGASLSQLKWNRYGHNPRALSKPRRLGDMGLLDSASRGPWGSLKLLCRPYPQIGLAGALITVAALAFDFFAQQVTVIDYRLTPLTNGTGPGAITRSEKYDKWVENGQHMMMQPDANTTAGIYNAIMDPVSISAPPLQCSTGNCTWPDTSSLAVCGACTDITDTVSFECRKDIQGVQQRTQTCIYRVPEGRTDYEFSISMINATYGNYGTQALQTIEMLWYPEEGPDYDDGLSPSRYYNDTNVGYIKNFFVVDSSFRYAPQVIAHTCALWWCVQTYRTVVENGVLNQEIVANYSQANRTSVAGERTYSNITDLPFHDLNVPEGTQFAWSLQTTRAYEQNAFFNSTTAFPDDAGSPGAWFYRDSWGPFFMRVSDWNVFIDNVALSMTNNVRAAGSSTTPASRYIGQVIMQEAFVRVRWPWLIYPAALILGSTTFLFACIWDTHRRQIPVWKDDALALLFSHVHPDVKEYFGDAKASRRDHVWLDISESIPTFRRIEAETGRGRLPQYSRDSSRKARSSSLG